MELILTFGLVSVILGTASGAQNLGVIGALGVGSYIALAGLWGSPISGASMNPARTFGPDVVAANFPSYWVYVAGPLAGACAAVAVAFVLRGAAVGVPAPAPPRVLSTPRSDTRARSERRAPIDQIRARAISTRREMPTMWPSSGYSVSSAPAIPTVRSFAQPGGTSWSAVPW